MLETLDRMMLAGLGAWSMTRENAERIFDDYVRRGQAERHDRTSFIGALMKTSEDARRDLGEFVARQVRETLTRLDLPTRGDIERLEAKIDLLLGQKRA